MTRSQPRPTADETIFKQLEAIAERSTCPRKHVAAALVIGDVVLATGYNGAPRGMDHCDDVGCLIVDGHCERAVHAEHNAILNAARYGVSIVGATMYCTVNPCFRCRMYCTQVGVVDFNFRDTDYVDRYPELGR